MGHTNRNTEENSAKSHLKCRGLAQEVSEEKNFSMLLRDCSCNILVKNVTAYCPCLKSPPEG